MDNWRRKIYILILILKRLILIISATTCIRIGLYLSLPLFYGVYVSNIVKPSQALPKPAFLQSSVSGYPAKQQKNLASSKT
jgi:hypothetical protein